MEFQVLGSVGVRIEGESLELGKRRMERCLFGLFLLNIGAPVTIDRLTFLLWGEHPPEQSRSTLQVLVSRLRAWLTAHRADEYGVRLVTRAGGYVLEGDPERVDAHRFRRLCEEGRSASDPVDRLALLRKGLALWHGPPIADVGTEYVRQAVGQALEELYLDSTELRFDAQLELGQHVDLVGELSVLVAEYPFRERFAEQLMLSLYRAGRQKDALAVYDDTRRTLAEHVGLDPRPELADLHRRILRSDPALVDPGPPRQTGPAQLPQAVPDFTGRRAQIEFLDGLLDNPGAVVISTIGGVGGVGKTALAVHWAHQVRDRFPDGQLYLNLHGFSPAPVTRPIDALARFLRALGVPAEQIPLDVEEASSMYRSQIADKRMLILLDNAHSPEQVRSLLPGGAGNLALITSRSRLGGLVARDGARRLDLEVLDGAESLALFGRILGRGRLDAEREAAADLADACGHLPLALRIAAAHLADDPTRTIADYLAQLRAGDRLTALAVDGDELSSIRATFELSYAALDPATAWAFGLLGLVPGQDFTPEAVAALTGSDVPEARRYLSRLLAAHLVEVAGADRYTLHDLLRLYAREKADPAGAQSAMGSLMEWYLCGVDAAARKLYPHNLRLPVAPSDSFAFADHVEALAWLDGERGNLVAAVVGGAESGQREAAWRIADALRGYFWIRRHTVDWLAAAQAALAAAEAEGDAKGQATAHQSLGLAFASASRHEQAIAHSTRALALSEHEEWPEYQAAALGTLGTSANELGRLADAVGYYTQALGINRRIGRETGAAINLTNRGGLNTKLGQLDDALADLLEAMPLAQAAGARFMEAAILGNLGELYHARGELDLAVECHTKCLALAREVGSEESQAEALRGLAEVHRDAGRLDQAWTDANAALELARKVGEYRAEAQSMVALGTILHRRGQFHEALARHEQARTLSRQHNIRHGEIDALTGVAETLLSLGRPDPAPAEEAVRLAREANFPLREARASAVLAAIRANGAPAPILFA
ncbi:SARP family transcriptional regulator [Longispora fulva]|uniref:DNA-binding SARP family transcriptional activator n=1 Tax=Longispora fulva TaxID=619741 RepID=A0A8J7GQU5_9ACTN|nr:BTAD domain-containing putative transcriptional regulator [Longispora fulva]MBG6138860.1 DNA-binding SARP family transcriptional activator [Longispora fulva]GIG58353.1 SARP family transcriptional regulator [Longispora fulva]